MNGGHQPESSQPPSDSQRASWVRWQIVLLLMAFSFTNWFNRRSFKIAANHEQFRQEFSLSPEAIGTIDSAMLFAYTLCMTPGGWFTDRKGPWLALSFMGLGTGLCVFLTALPGLGLLTGALVLPAFWGARALLGVCSSPIYPACGRVVMHWLPFRQRATATGLIFGAAPFGIAFTSVLIAYMTDRIGWRMVFLITGAITLALTCLWLLYATNYPAQHRGVNQPERELIGAQHLQEEAPALGAVAPPRPGTWMGLLRNRSLLCLAASYAAIGYFEYVFFFWMDYYFSNVLKLDPDRSRFYSMIPPLAMAAGMPFGGWLCDRLMRSWGYKTARRLVPVTGMIFAAGMLVLGVVATNAEWIVLWFSLALFACGTIEGPLWTTAFDIGGRRGATAGAIVNTAGNAGGMPAPTLTAVVGEAVKRATGDELFGWQCSLLLGGLICFTGVFLWFWINPEDRVREDD